MSGTKKLHQKKIPCEFAMDCLTPDGTYCPDFDDPDDCEKYRRLIALEDEDVE